MIIHLWKEPTTEWTDWFAWRLVIIENDLIWLELIQRRLIYNNLESYIEYRFKPLNKTTGKE